MAIAIYIRKSSESEDRQVQSLEDQRKVLLEYAGRNGIAVAEILEESRSAKQPGTRPVFKEMIRRIEAGEIHGLLVWHMNRLSRNMLDGGQIAHMLYSGRLDFIRTPERTYLPEDSALLLAIENGVSTSFIQDLRRNTLRGMVGKAERGWMPFHPPMGYVYNKLTHEIEIDPVRFPIVQYCWKKLLGGTSTLADVMREAQSMGLNSSVRSGKLHRSAFCALFRNTFYFGEFAFQGLNYKGKHIPMVTKTEFERVQQILSGRLRMNKSKHPKKFSGLMKCAKCGCSITGETKVKTYPKTGRTVTYTYYHCTGAKGCKKTSFNESHVLRLLQDQSEFVRLPVGVLPWLADELKKYVGFLAQTDTASDQARDEQLQKLKGRLSRLHKMRLDEELTASEYRELKCGIESSIVSVTTESASRVSKVAGLGEMVRDKLMLLEQVSGFDWLQSELSRGLLKQLGRNYFLTLENLKIDYDPVVSAICTFEPLKDGSYSQQWPGLNLTSSVWRPR